MALYLNNKKFNIFLGMNIASLAARSRIIERLLLSSDGYVLKDSNGLYLTYKESE